jgi:16S rRNA (cytosine1402-N4)-methyltransferase
MDYHQPVLEKEVIDSLHLKPNGIYLDATLGNGGHTISILKIGATVFGLDQDKDNLKLATTRIKTELPESKFYPIHGNFSNLFAIYESFIKSKLDGILFDLGLSKNQQLSNNRGFSFNDQNSLDMRLDPETQAETAEFVINTYDYLQLYDIFTKYTQELYSKPLILRIIKERQKSPIKTASRLAEIIRFYYQEHRHNTRLDPATKIFLALRIHVNQEYQNLNNTLSASLKITKMGGTVAVISFHSGEDRIVKQFFKKISSTGQISLSPIKHPSFLEVKNNPLSRSATLRSYTLNYE